MYLFSPTVPSSSLNHICYQHHWQRHTYGGAGVADRHRAKQLVCICGREDTPPILIGRCGASLRIAHNIVVASSDKVSPLLWQPDIVWVGRNKAKGILVDIEVVEVVCISEVMTERTETSDALHVS